MQFTEQTSSNGVVERSFTLGEITGVIWSPVSGSDHAPVVLTGHGGGLHKKAPGVVARAHHCVTACGFTVVAIDAPGHGDRPRSARDEQWVAALRQARAAGEPMESIIVDYNSSLAERAVPEWQATLDALQALPEIGTEAQIGYSGLTLGTAIGVPLTAVEPRITAAVFGGAFETETLTQAAQRITVPIQVLLPWDDEVLSRRHGLALFDAFASKEKTLHAFPGGHHEVPWHEAEDAARFFQRHLN
jgi:alpha-beta hydrolase superfamily lysophospholipase